MPYLLHVDARQDASDRLSLIFRNAGRKGAVFQVYDHRHLDRLPRRYTVEAGRMIADVWTSGDGGFDLFVLGPASFFRGFARQPGAWAAIEADLRYQPASRSIELMARNCGRSEVSLEVRANAYYAAGPWQLAVAPGKQARRSFSFAASKGWYDVTISGGGVERRFAGRIETGAPSISDPAIGVVSA